MLYCAKQCVILYSGLSLKIDMRLPSYFSLFLGLLTLCDNVASGITYKNNLQDIVTYDQYSFKVNGTRLFLFSGEFHPFRFALVL